MEPMTFSISPGETKLAREMLPEYTSGVFLAKMRYERLTNPFQGRPPAVVVRFTLSRGTSGRDEKDIPLEKAKIE